MWESVLFYTHCRVEFPLFTPFPLLIIISPSRVAQGRPLEEETMRDDPGLWDETLDLTPYINMSAFKARSSWGQGFCWEGVC